jgi:hypothetical protein
MIPIKALGQTSAQATAKSRTIEALILKRSSRVMPGLRGTPAGMMTTSQPSRELYFNKNKNNNKIIKFSLLICIPLTDQGQQSHELWLLS